MNRIILTEAEAENILSALKTAEDFLSRNAEKTGPPYKANMDRRIEEYSQLAKIINFRLEHSRNQP